MMRRPFGELFAVPPRNGLTRPKATRGAGTKMVNMGELFAHPRIRDVEMDRVPLDEVEASRFLLEPGDLLFARQSLVLEGAGKCSIFLGDHEPVTFESHVTRVRLNDEVADPAFYYYYLQSFEGRTTIRSIVEQGAGAAGIRGSDLARLPVAWCDLDRQRAIARVLSSLDEKIELSHRTSQTLEAVAHALFRSWFIDLEPLHALNDGLSDDEAANRFALHKEALSHFANELINTEGQLLPIGWRVSSLGEEVRVHGGVLQTGPFGSQLHASDYAEDGVPVVMPQDMVRRRIATDRIARVPEDTANSLSRHRLRAGDIVYSRRGDVERHARVTGRETGWLCGTGCLLVRIGSSWPSLAYLSEVLNDRGTREWIVRHAVGATMPNLNTSILSALPLLVPPRELLQEYERVIAPMIAQQEALSAEAESLTQLRDELLPRLHAGELVVT